MNILLIPFGWAIASLFVGVLIGIVLSPLLTPLAKQIRSFLEKQQRILKKIYSPLYTPQKSSEPDIPTSDNEESGVLPKSARGCATQLCITLGDLRDRPTILAKVHEYFAERNVKVGKDGYEIVNSIHHGGIPTITLRVEKYKMELELKKDGPNWEYIDKKK